MSWRFRPTEPRTCDRRRHHVSVPFLAKMSRQRDGGSEKGKREPTLTNLFLAALLLRNAKSNATESIESFDDASGRRAKRALSCAAGPAGMEASGVEASSLAMGFLWYAMVNGMRRRRGEEGRTRALPLPHRRRSCRQAPQPSPPLPPSSPLLPRRLPHPPLPSPPSSPLPALPKSQQAPPPLNPSAPRKTSSPPHRPTSSPVPSPPPSVSRQYHRR